MSSVNTGLSLHRALALKGRQVKWLAHTIGMAPNAVSRMKRQKSARLFAIECICDALEMRVSEFIALGEAREDSYINCTGGQPVSDDIMVDVMFMDGDTDADNNKHSAEWWDWSLTGEPGDIIAYRVIEQE